MTRHVFYVVAKIIVPEQEAVEIAQEDIRVLLDHVEAESIELSFSPTKALPTKR